MFSTIGSKAIIRSKIYQSHKILCPKKMGTCNISLGYLSMLPDGND